MAEQPEDVAESRWPAHVEMGQGSRTVTMLDFFGVIRILRQHILLIAGTAVVGTGIAVAFLLLAPPQYKSTASLLIEMRPQKISNLEEVLPPLNPDTSSIESQVELLRSQNIAERVVRELGPNSNEWHTLKPQEAAANLLRHLTVERKGLSQLIDITYQSSNGDWAAKVANAVASAYITDQLEVKRKATEDATRWLEARVAELGMQVRESEERVRKYQAEHGLTGMSDAQSNPRAIADATQQRAGVLSTAKSEDVARNEAIIRLGELERDSDVTGQLYNELLKRLKETQLLQNLQTADARVIIAAGAPSLPSSPKTFPTLGLAFSGSLLIGVLAALAKANLAALP